MFLRTLTQSLRKITGGFRQQVSSVQSSVRGLKSLFTSQKKYGQTLLKQGKDILPAKKKGKKDQKPEAPPKKTLHEAFLEISKKLADDTQSIEEVPLILTVGESGKSEGNLFGNSGFSTMYEATVTCADDDQHTVTLLSDYTLAIDVDSHSFLLDKYPSFEKSGLSKILKKIISYRPRRPLSSLIVKLPFTLLKSEDGAVEVDKNMQKYAERYLRGMQYIIKTLGFNVPIYFVLNDAQEIYGFQDFAKTIPAESKQSIFGWSNPYELELSYTENWYDQIVFTLSGFVSDFTALNFTRHVEPKTAQKIFLFREEFAVKMRTMRNFFHYMSSMDNPLVGQLLLRGIYILGSEEGGHGKNPLKYQEYRGALGKEILEINVQAKPDPLSQTLFFRHLYDTKIAKEFLLAYPFFSFTNAKVRRNFILASIFSMVVVAEVASLIYGYETYSSNTNRLLPLVQNTNDTIARYRAQTQNDVRVTKIYLSDVSVIYSLLNFQNDYHFRTPLFPISYVRNVDKNIDRAIDTLLTKVIFSPLKVLLKQKSEALVSQDSSDAQSADEIRHTYFKLDNFLKGVNQLKEYYNQYNSFSTSVNIDRLNSTIGYALNVDLSDVLGQKNIVYTMKNYQNLFSFLKFSDNNAPVHQKFNLLSKNFLDALRADTNLGEVLEKFSRTLSESKKMDVESTSEPVFYLREISKEMDYIYKNTSQVISGNQVVALDGEELRIDNLYGEATSTGSFQDTDIEKFKVDITAALNYRSKKFTSYKTDMLGSIFEKKDAKSDVKLSADFITLRNALLEYTKLPFMTSVVSKDVSMNTYLDSFNRSFNFDFDGSMRLIQSFEKFKNFMNTTGKTIPEAILNIVRDSAAYSFTKQLYEISLNTPVRSQSVGDDDNQRFFDKVKQFNEIAPNIEKLDKMYKDVDANMTARFLTKFYFEEASGYIFTLRKKFNAEKLYSFDHAAIKNWSGVRPLAYDAFRVNSSRDLEDYVNTSAAQANQYGLNYARPMVEYLSRFKEFASTNISNEIAYWSETIQQEADKSVSSAQKKLHDYILNITGIMLANNCSLLLQQYRDDKFESNFFDRRRLEISSMASEKCGEIRERTAAVEYNRLAKIFDEKLAGRPPFDDYVPGAQATASPVEPNIIHDFLYDFSLFYKDLYKENNQLKSSTYLNHPRWKDALLFIKKMQNLSLMFSSFYSDFSNLTMNLKFDFSKGVYDEENTASIIERKIEMGNSRVSNVNRKTRLQWRVGLPIQISFRYAYSSKQTPVSPPSSGSLSDPEDHYQVENKAALFRFNDPWSLITLFKMHGTKANSEFYNPTLGFKIFTSQDEKEKSSRTKLPKNRRFDAANAILRVSLFDPQKGTLTPVAVVPTYAPILPLDSNGFFIQQ